MTAPEYLDQAASVTASGTTPVVVGVDTHQQTHHAVILAGTGTLIATREFPASPAGYQQLWAWVCERAGAAGRARVAAVGVESTGSYGAGLAQFLLTTDPGQGWAAGVDVREVIRPEKTVRAMRGKSDPIDAEAAARAVLAGTATGRPKVKTGIVEAIRSLVVARESAVKQRTAAASQLRDLITTAPEPIRGELLGLSTARRVTRVVKYRPDTTDLGDPLQALKYALRALGRRIQALDAEIADADRALTPLVAAAAPRLLALPQVGTNTAAQLLITGGQNIDRMRSEAAFAKLVGVAPLPASSGKTTRHRLNRGGDRAANRALYLLVCRRLATDPATKAYMQRRSLDPRMGTPDIIRCLKRYAARQIYTALRADLLTA
jgi:transposase